MFFSGFLFLLFFYGICYLYLLLSCSACLISNLICVGISLLIVGLCLFLTPQRGSIPASSVFYLLLSSDTFRSVRILSVSLGCILCLVRPIGSVIASVLSSLWSLPTVCHAFRILSPAFDRWSDRLGWGGDMWFALVVGILP